MATVFDRLSLKGIRRADLRHLRCILEGHIESGVYWGNKAESYARNERLINWVRDAEEYAYSDGVLMPRKNKQESQPVWS